MLWSVHNSSSLMRFLLNAFPLLQLRKFFCIDLVMSGSILLIGLIIAVFLYFDETVNIIIRLIN